ncbi:MAG: PAS domain-containing protein [Parvibaculum sp.]
MNGKHGFLDPRLAYLFDYWRRKRGDRPAASRTDLMPSEIKPFLPIMNLLDVHREPLEFRHRLVGTEIVEAVGRDVTGRTVSPQLYGDDYEEILAGLRTVAEDIRPFRRLKRPTWFSRDWLSLEAIELPLIDSSGEVNMILRAMSLFADPQSASRERSLNWELAA